MSSATSTNFEIATESEKNVFEMQSSILDTVDCYFGCLKSGVVAFCAGYVVPYFTQYMMFRKLRGSVKPFSSTRLANIAKGIQRRYLFVSSTAFATLITYKSFKRSIRKCKQKQRGN